MFSAKTLPFVKKSTFTLSELTTELKTEKHLTVKSFITFQNRNFIRF